MIKQAPKAIIEDGKVVNHEELKRYWADYHDRKDRMQRMMFQDMRDAEPLVTKPQVVEHIHRHSDMGKKEFDLLQQMVLKVDHLDEKVNELYKKKKGNIYKYK